MQIKYKLQIIALIIIIISMLIILIDLLFIKKAFRQHEALSNKQRIIVPFKELKEQYNK